MQYPMANQIKEPNLYQLVQVLQINIKVNRKSRPHMASMLVTHASVILAIIAPVILAIIAPVEKTQLVTIIIHS
jgi:hypothetical protein